MSGDRSLIGLGSLNRLPVGAGMLQFTVSTTLWRVGLFLIGVWEIWWVPDVVFGELDSCSSANFVQAVFFERSSDRTVVCIHSSSMRCFAYLEGDRWVGAYPWVNVSDGEPERRLAASQLVAMVKMTHRFSFNNTFLFEVVVSDTITVVAVNIDEAYASWNVESSSLVVEEEQNIDAVSVQPYVDVGNITAFLESRSDVLNRWRDVCRVARGVSTREGTGVTFLYWPSNGTFECSVDSPAPEFYRFGLECAGSNESQHWVVQRPSDFSVRQAMMWSDPQCDVLDANCTVKTDGFEIAVGVEIMEDVLVINAHESDVDIGVTVSFFVVGAILGSVACGRCLRRTCGRGGVGAREGV